MLSELRKRSRSAIIYVLFGIIIAAFILTFNTKGPTKGCTGTKDVTMANVAGITIDYGLLRMGAALTPDPPQPGVFTRESFERQQIYNNTRFLSAGSDIELMSFMPYEVPPLKYRRVMNDLVETYLVSSTAEKLGLRVDDDDLAHRLYENPRLRYNWYDEDGKFDKRRFNRFVQYSLGTSASRYEDFIRREILREKLIRILSSQVSVASAEVDYEWRQRNDKVDLAYASFDPSEIARTVKIAQADLKKAREDRKEAIASWYEKNKKRFQKEERAQVHGIFFQAPLKSQIDRADNDADKKKLEEDRAAAHQKAVEALKALRAGATATTAAADDLEALKKRAIPIKAGDTVHGTTAPGANADTPAATPDTKKPATVPGFVPVATFERIAKARSEHQATKDDGGRFSDLKPRSAFAIWPFGEGVDAAVFALKPGQTTEVLEIPNGFWIIRLDRHVAAENQTLEQAQDEIARILIAEDGAEESAKAAAAAFLSDAQKAQGESLDALVKAWNAAHPVLDGDTSKPALSVKKTGPFALISGSGATEIMGSVPGLGKDEELARAAFRLTDEAPVAGQVFEESRGAKKLFIVARLAERVPADTASADDAKKELRDQLQRTRERERYRAWYTDLLQTASENNDVVESADFRALVTSEQTEYNESMKRRLGAQAQKQGQPSFPIKLQP